MMNILLDFTIGFWTSFAANVGIACASLAIGLLLGIPLGYAQYKGNVIAKVLLGPTISLMRVFPIFVLMFVLWNFLPNHRNQSENFLLSGAGLILVLALCAYSITVLTDAVADAFHFFNLGRTDRVWLLVPNIFRIFATLVASTSIGAAIGVREAVSYSLLFSDGLVHRSEKVFVLSLATCFFVFFLVLFKAVLDKATHKFKATYLKNH